MGEKIKDYKKMKEEFEGLGPKLNAVESKIHSLNDEFDPLEEEFLKYQILEDPRAEGLKKQMDEIGKEKKGLKEELETGRKKLKIMSGILAEKRLAARREINQSYQKTFESKARKFVKLLKEAEEQERELRELREQGRQELRDIDDSEDALKIPNWPVVLMPGLKNSQKSNVKSFIEFIEGNSKIKLGG